MITVVHYAAAPAAPRHLDIGADIAVIDSAGSPAALSGLRARLAVDVILAEIPAETSAEAWLAPAQGATIVALVDGTAEDAALDALHAGASAVLPATAGDGEIAGAIISAAHGLAMMPQVVLRDLLATTGEPASLASAEAAVLTARELEVLRALADGASNKMIARRLGISFHTVKFHVASILAKLDADTRTEAVAQAARLGLVML
jgi:DNA-binding NarL/FixJ family response regulator